jgi:hypothetical protein
MKYNKKPTKLARKIAGHLLTERTTPTDFVCASTGDVITGSCNYSKVKVVNADAVGAHYIAYGFMYLLCIDAMTGIHYVAIHRMDETSALVAIMHRVGHIQVVDDAKTA